MKTLYYDIESNGVNARNSDLGLVIVFGYAWNDEPAQSIILTKKQLSKFDDRKLLEKASKLMKKADLLVGHYASVFDRRFLQGRMLIHGMPPPTQAVVRDTVFAYRRAAAFSSNRLKHLANVLKLKNRKLENNWPDAWFQIMRGDMEALRKLAIYCRGDVEAVRELYLRVKPFVKSWGHDG